MQGEREHPVALEPPATKVGCDLRRRMSGSAADISSTRSNFSSFRSSCHFWW